MNKSHLLVLMGLVMIIVLNMVSSAEAASIVRTQSSPGSGSYAQQYTIQGAAPCSTIGRTYTKCKQDYPSVSYSPPRADSSYSTALRYAESPEGQKYPQETTRINKNSQAINTNFDTATSSYDYRGPLYERRIISTDDFIHDVSAKSGFFSSNSKDLITRSIRNEVVEKYVGATESLYTDSKNNRVFTQSASDTSTRSYDGGFSFGKQRLFDQTEYGRDSYSREYYYRPFLGNGFYNWRY